MVQKMMIQIPFFSYLAHIFKTFLKKIVRRLVFDMSICVMMILRCLLDITSAQIQLFDERMEFQ